MGCLPSKLGLTSSTTNSGTPSAKGLGDDINEHHAMVTIAKECIVIKEQLFTR
jgi:hypothetical protein